MGPNINATTRLPARKGISEFEIFSVNDFPPAAAGVITLPTGNYVLKSNLTITDRFEIEPNATVHIYSENLSYVLILTNTGTLFSNVSGAAADFRMSFITVIPTGIGAQFFDLTVTFFEVLTFVCPFSAASQSIGNLVGQNGVPAMGIRNSQIVGWTDGLTVDGFDADNLSIFFMDAAAYQSTFATSNTFVTMGKYLQQIDIQNGTILIGPSEKAFFIDPALLGVAKLNDMNLAAFGAFYETRLTGIITAFADASIGATAVTSVSDVGGIAEFNFTGPTVYVGQEVVQSTFGESTYNVTRIITVTNGTSTYQTGVAYAAPDTGSFLSNSVTVTSTGHGLAEATSLSIKDTLDYDSGQSIYNSLTNTFQINRTWEDTESGSWDTGSLTGMANTVTAKSNPGQLDSTVSAESEVTGNVLATSIVAQDALTILNIAGALGSEENRVKVLDDGTFRSEALNRVTVLMDGNVLLEPDNSTKSLTCRFGVARDAQNVVTFTNGTNTVDEVGTALVDDDNITFLDNEGTLPVGLVDNVIYYVISAATDSFQLSYTKGGSAVAFTTDGSGTNSYKVSEVFGSTPTAPIQANNPSTLYPQALHTILPQDKGFVLVKNNQDTTNVNILDSYYRIAM
jgi:hypothetical protein